MDKQKKNKYSFKSLLSKIILGLAITIFILLLIIFLTTDTKNIVQAFKHINIPNLCVAISLTIIYFILSPITTCILTKTNKCNISMLDTYLIANTEHFFNGITPFATGGQPFQVYSYARLNVTPADSTGILIMNYLINVAFINLFAIISVIIFPQLLQAVGNLLPLIIVGFAVNILAYLLIVLLACSERVADFLVKLLTLLSKIKVLNKFIVPAIPAFQKYCNDTQTAFKALWKHKLTALICFFIRTITMLIYYAITFYILRSFNINVQYKDFLFVMCGTAFVIIGCVFVPTPGGSGGIEFAFTSIFVFIASGITSDIGASGMLLWRILTYYGLMFISFINYLILEKRTNKFEKVHRVLALEPPAIVFNDTNSNSCNNDKFETENVENDVNLITKIDINANELNEDKND